MRTEADKQRQIVAVALNGGRVTAGFRAALFLAAAKAGVSVNEFVLTAAAEKLKSCGAEFPGVFAPGDTDPSNDNAQQLRSQFA